MYCSKCGKELNEGSKFCQNCGAPVNPEVKPKSSVVERFETDTNLQEHWIKRSIAYIIDSIIVFVATSILVGIFYFPVFIANPGAFFDILSFPFAMGLLYILYFTIAESINGATIGKGLMGLKVVMGGNDKHPGIEKTFIRNISKIHWVLLLLDIVGGLLTSTELYQKYSDRLADTKVI